jgi:hypothetical protein
MKRNFTRWFPISALCILAFTGITKLISAFSAAPILEQIDPVVGIRTRDLLLLVGILELTTVVLILTLKNKSLPSLLTAILGAQFLLYRSVFQVGNFYRGCPCLGRFTAWAHLPDLLINRILCGLAAWLCVGGILCFFLSMPKNERIPPVNSEFNASA